MHDHQVWGLVGMLRGSETSQAFVRDERTVSLSLGPCATLAPGDVEKLRPDVGDIHQVTNALADTGSISIHVYGGNIGAIRRYTFDPATGEPTCSSRATPTRSCPTCGTARPRSGRRVELPANVTI